MAKKKTTAKAARARDARDARKAPAKREAREAREARETPAKREASEAREARETPAKREAREAREAREETAGVRPVGRAATRAERKAAANTRTRHARGEKLDPAKKGALPTANHRRVCLTDANRVGDSIVDLHDSAFDGPKVLYNGQWYSHIDTLPDGTWRYAPM